MRIVLSLVIVALPWAALLFGAMLFNSPGFGDPVITDRAPGKRTHRDNLTLLRVTVGCATSSGAALTADLTRKPPVRMNALPALRYSDTPVNRFLLAERLARAVAAE